MSKKPSFAGVLKPRGGVPLPEPDLAALEAIAGEAPSRSLPEKEAQVVAADGKVLKEARRVTKEGDATVQINVRVSKMDWKRFKNYCTNNEVTMQEHILAMIRALP